MYLIARVPSRQAEFRPAETARDAEIAQEKLQRVWLARGRQKKGQRTKRGASVGREMIISKSNKVVGRGRPPLRAGAVSRLAQDRGQKMFSSPVGRPAAGVPPAGAHRAPGDTFARAPRPPFGVLWGLLCSLGRRRAWWGAQNIVIV